MVLKKYFLNYDTICVVEHFAQPSPGKGGLGITQSILGVGWAMKETSISH